MYLFHYQVYAAFAYKANRNEIFFACTKRNQPLFLQHDDLILFLHSLSRSLVKMCRRMTDLS